MKRIKPLLIGNLYCLALWLCSMGALWRKECVAMAIRLWCAIGTVFVPPIITSMRKWLRWLRSARCWWRLFAPRWMTFTNCRPDMPWWWKPMGRTNWWPWLNPPRKKPAVLNAFIFRAAAMKPFTASGNNWVAHCPKKCFKPSTTIYAIPFFRLFPTPPKRRFMA